MGCGVDRKHMACWVKGWETERNKWQDLSVKCCVTAKHTSCATPVLRNVFWRTFLEDTPNSSAPNGTIGFPGAVKQYHRWSQRNTIINRAPSSTLSSSHPPVAPKNIQLQGFSQQRRVCDLWPLATLTSRSDLWRNRLNKNNCSWGRDFKVLWPNT